ncbi:MAG: hypothetical protein K2N44_19945 [Lachnospiraceae bacterium]|nr:hypothetical protein [Lachnospiraceae bacterium]
MKHQKIFLCRKCGTLDYAAERCPKCGSIEIDRADIEFLRLGSSAVPSPVMPILLMGIHSIEKIGWNGSNKIIRKH